MRPSAPVGEGWEERWKAFHEPVRAGGLWIGPPWIAPPPGEPAVMVDPGRAFGTGAHPTTRACIELLARIEPGSLLDAGCGSGVVAVAAARLGFAPVRAFDVDLVAVEVARETARGNEVAIDVFARRRTGRRPPVCGRRRREHRAPRRRGSPEAGEREDSGDRGLPRSRDAGRAGHEAGRSPRARGLGGRRLGRTALS